MNFIFDVGDVLIEYKPIVYLRSLFSDDALVNELNETVFKSPEWLIMDEGLLTHKEAIKIFCERKPELEAEICRVMEMESYGRALYPLRDTLDLLPGIKKTGHGLYYLSNMHMETRDFIIENYDFLDMFDGGVFSCNIKHRKPFPEIYRFLLKEYSLKPEECIFFDDVQENVDAAEKEGIKGVLFTGAECIKAETPAAASPAE